MAPKQTPIVLPPGCTPTSLIPIQQLLHLTAHRNKNQHRVAKWWASFSLLRRQLGKLVAQLEDPDAAFRAKKIEIEKRVVFLREEIVPRCYLAFSAVVADNQYASLGLMLMGCLARLNKLISFPREREVEGADEEVKVEKTTPSHMLHTEDLGEAVSREEMENLVKRATKSLKTPKKGKRSANELLGIEIASPSEQPLSSVSTKAKKVITETVGTSEGEETLSSPSKQTTTEKKPKKVVETTVTTTSSKTTTLKPPNKKRKRVGDEFDELFKDLI